MSAQLAVVDFPPGKEAREASLRTIKELRQRAPAKLPVIGVTADHDLLRRASSRFAGVPHFALIGKPFSLDELLDVVAAMLLLDGDDPPRLFDHLDVGVLVVDAQQRYTYANRVALDLLGYTLDELRLKRVPDLMTTSQRSTDELWRRYVKEGGMSAERFELCHHDGHRVSVHIHSSVLQRSPGEEPFFVAWLRP